MTSPLPTPVVPTRPLARLGESHGYRIEGDAAHLHAAFREIAGAAHDRNWALQLWACPAVPQTAAGLDGHLVAEAWLPPLAEFEDSGADFDVVAAATPPAGTAEWIMVLVLVAARGDRFDEVHDLVAYPRHERFTHPRLQGGMRHVIAGDRVQLEMTAVANPREAGNVSGTLSLELWALAAPYTGGQFEGVSLAGAVLGTLAGQAQWQGLSFDLLYAPPPPGTWHLVVMLREWVGHGYVTRDFFSLGAPLVVAASEVAVPAVVAETPAPAAPAKVARVRKSATAPTPAPTTAPTPAPAVPPKRAKKSAPPKA